MKTVSVYDVQHHFSRVLERVISGETVIISRHRIPVAKLVPASPENSAPPMPDFMARLKKNEGNKRPVDGQPLLDEMREDRF